MKQILCALILLAALGCRKDRDLLYVAEYVISNKTVHTLVFKATEKGTQADLPLELESLASGTTATLLIRKSTSWDPMLPEDTFEKFEVYTENFAPANLIYSKVSNSNWVAAGPNKAGHLEYHLAIYR